MQPASKFLLDLLCALCGIFFFFFGKKIAILFCFMFMASQVKLFTASLIESFPDTLLSFFTHALRHNNIWVSGQECKKEKKKKERRT